MPVIRKENNSLGMENEQKSKINIENGKSIKQNNIITTKNVATDLIDPEISGHVDLKKDQTDDVIISKTDDFLAKANKVNASR